FGADPFWPYNHQYTPYVAPIGPADPVAGGRPAMVPRTGIRGANQFESYMEDLQGQGPGRGTSDRAGIGVPYFRSAVTPRSDWEGRDRRQSQPNPNDRNRNYEQIQRNLADKYFAYFSERDPARRADLLKEYRQARREASLALSGRGRSPSRVLDDA